MIAHLARASAWVVLLVTIVAPASPQKLAKRYRPLPQQGVEFKPLDDFTDVPVSEQLATTGLVVQMDSLKVHNVDSGGGTRTEYKPALRVYFVPIGGPESTPQSPEDGQPDDEKKGKKRSTTGATPTEYLRRVFPFVEEIPDPDSEEFEASKGIEGTRHEFTLETRGSWGGKVPTQALVFRLRVDLGELVFIWHYPSEKKLSKKYDSLIKKSMKSVRPLDADEVVQPPLEVDADSSYPELLKAHQADVDQTPGWELYETASRRYLVKTNSEDKKDLNDVITRLELARDMFEEDFPPSQPITAVSVVRICATRRDFNTYGQTGGGVAGFFNPRSEELVLFLGGGRDMALSVMAHEAFHQYCHFLFERSEAHRWFDEGHGDYYGAWKQKGKRLIQQDDMKGGLSRVPELKQMIRTGDLKPLSEHIRFNHPEWQYQGPSGVSPYAQSFALIYFLRQGAKRKVKSRYWSKEYAEIIPNYIRTLHAGYQEAFEAVRASARARLENDPKNSHAQERLERPWDFVHDRKKAIWEAAMKASWGQIDEAEFEKRWLQWVDAEL